MYINPVFNFQYYLLLKDKIIVLRPYKPLPQTVRTTAFIINEGYPSHCYQYRIWLERNLEKYAEGSSITARD
jgi:hypothetical protein